MSAVGSIVGGMTDTKGDGGSLRKSRRSQEQRRDKRQAGERPHCVYVRLLSWFRYPDRSKERQCALVEDARPRYATPKRQEEAFKGLMK